MTGKESTYFGKIIAHIMDMSYDCLVLLLVPFSIAITALMLMIIHDYSNLVPGVAFLIYAVLALLLYIVTAFSTYKEDTNHSTVAILLSFMWPVSIAFLTLFYSILLLGLGWKTLISLHNNIGNIKLSKRKPKPIIKEKQPSIGAYRDNAICNSCKRPH